MMLKKNLAMSRLLAALILGASALFFATGCPEAGTTPNIENPDPDPDPETEPENKAPPSTAGKTIVDGATDQTGRLVSVGKVTVAGATTYYIDAVNGNDTWDGKDPLRPWKSFKNINSKKSSNSFKPGDHILLEADSIWNGSPVPATTAWKTFYRSARVGMIAITNYGDTYAVGNGEEGKPIVIDLYDIKYNGSDTGDPYTATDIKVYYSADKRPIINGGGTPALPFHHPYSRTGVINFFNASYWEVYNLELTNTFDDPLTTPDHWRKFIAGTTAADRAKIVKKGLCGINADSQWGKDDGKPKDKHIYIKNVYIHDVQSEHNNNKPSGPWYFSNYFDSVYDRKLDSSERPGKTVGGITLNIGNGLVDSRVENCIVKKVSLAGIRSAGNINEDMLFKNNYVEQTTGDGMVLSAVMKGGLVEGNIVKEACNGDNLGTANYAACWAMNCQDSTFQFNEAYGTVYGWNDGEAWDTDDDCNRVVYQYNYSHHNAGGAILFMSASHNSVFRYNISANDGGGTKYLATVNDNTGRAINTSADSYTTWNNGQSIFHYTSTGTTSNNNLPLIYNNLFYTGDGITCGLFGHHTNSAVSKYVRFYNNIVLKVGTGTLYLGYGQQSNGTAGSIFNPTGMKNNLFWGYDQTDPTAGIQSKFNNGGGMAVATLFTSNDNKWENPKLKIQESANVAALRAHRDTLYPEVDFTDMTKLNVFTSRDRLKNRASIFTPVDNSSPVINAGMNIPIGSGPSEVDGAWNNLTAQYQYTVNQDFFGNTITSTTTPIGPANASYSAAGSVTD